VSCLKGEVHRLPWGLLQLAGLRPGAGTLTSARFRNVLLGLDEYTTELEREYPFLAITIDPDAGDLERYTKEHAEEIGRLFTGV
jgi:hypothetical protein